MGTGQAGSTSVVDIEGTIEPSTRLSVPMGKPSALTHGAIQVTISAL